MKNHIRQELFPRVGMASTYLNTIIEASKFDEFCRLIDRYFPNSDEAYISRIIESEGEWILDRLGLPTFFDHATAMYEAHDNSGMTDPCGIAYRFCKRFLEEPIHYDTVRKAWAYLEDRFGKGFTWTDAKMVDEDDDFVDYIKELHAMLKDNKARYSAIRRALSSDFMHPEEYVAKADHDPSITYDVAYGNGKPMLVANADTYINKVVKDELRELTRLFKT